MLPFPRLAKQRAAPVIIVAGLQLSYQDISRSDATFRLDKYRTPPAVPGAVSIKGQRLTSSGK